MFRRCAWLFVFFAILFVPAAALAEPADEPTLTEGLRDKGVDWLKDKAKDAGEDWIFETGQSETMREILLKARERADGDGNDKAGLCQGAVMGKASSILNDINYAWTAKTAGKLAFDAVTKIAALASGFGGAAAEGGALDWLDGQYADAAKGQAKDAVFDKFKKLFGEEKKPEIELYETSGKNGDCDYTLRAAWDIVERENIERASLGWPREHMTDQWVAEKKNFMPGVFPMVSLTGNWSDVAHYTQMIWPTTTDLGCGSATGSGHEWLVCRYSPGGNKDGNPVG